MSEHTENTPSIEIKEDDTQPIKPIKAVKKPARWKSNLIGIFGFLLLVGLGLYGGYRSAVQTRLQAERKVVSRQVSEQYEFALIDIQFERYDAAKQRLEFIIQQDPSFPGVSQLYTDLLVKSNMPTATPAPSLTPTPDFSAAESAFARAQQLIAAQDWLNSMGALDQIRKLDATYKTSLVDGMYFFALRNYGVSLVGQGNLEGGIYHITLAERFGPIDNTARVLRDNARYYLIGASFWELDWRLAVDYFSALGSSNLWDGTMTAAQRLHYAYMRYGDQRFANLDHCGAVEMYKNAESISALDQIAAKNYNQANQICFPATAIPTAITVTATTPPATDPPTEAPTEPPATP